MAAFMYVSYALSVNVRCYGRYIESKCKQRITVPTINAQADGSTSVAQNISPILGNNTGCVFTIVLQLLLQV